jgi:hypothetical protein
MSARPPPSSTLQLALLQLLLAPAATTAEFLLVDPLDFRSHYAEGAPCDVPPCGGINASTYEWAAANLPFFDCDDADLVAAYYFRTKTYQLAVDVNVILAPPRIYTVHSLLSYCQTCSLGGVRMSRTSPPSYKTYNSPG